MVQNDQAPDDMPTGPLPVLGTDGLPREPGVMPPPVPDREAPSIARERLEAREPFAEPAAKRPVSEISAETLRRQDLMTAAFVGAFVIVMLGIVVAMLWS